MVPSVDNLGLTSVDRLAKLSTEFTKSNEKEDETKTNSNRSVRTSIYLSWNNSSLHDFTTDGSVLTMVICWTEKGVGEDSVVESILVWTVF